MLDLQPADLVIVRTPGFAGKIIRFGEMLQDKPDLHNHVAMLHHVTVEGVAWFLEGRPGGLGWRLERSGASDGYLTSKWSVSNADQPKSGTQRLAALAAMEELIGKPYDWEAIESDAAAALHMPELWPKWGGQMPGHVVCSSSAAWAYGRASLAAPEAGGGRFVEPADWDAFIMVRGWISHGAAGTAPAAS